MKSVVVVLGMHRSGTSAITKGLNLLGVSLGDNLMPPKEGENDKGFWEDLDIYRLNEAILDELGLSWDAMSNLFFHDLGSDVYKKYKAQAVELIKEKLDKVDSFGIKDPRITILLPFWKTVFSDLGLDQKFLIVIRNPKSVADSLKKRNKFEVEKSLNLWMLSVVNSVNYTQGLTNVIVDYDDFMDFPEENLYRIATHLGLTAPDIESEEYAQYIEDFLSSELRHNRVSSGSNSFSKISTEIKSAYALLLDRALKKSNINKCEKQANEWNDITDYFAKNSNLRETIDALTVENNEYKKSNHMLNFRVDQLEKNFSDLLQEVDSIYESLASIKASRLGRIFDLVESVYLYGLLRPKVETEFKKLMSKVNKIEKSKGNKTAIHRRETSVFLRIKMLANVFLYFCRHPYSSLRLVSPYRIKKLFETIFFADKGAAKAWISARFPQHDGLTKQPIIFEEDQSFDSITMEFPKYDKVTVSIIIPVFNQYRMTVSCLKSVLEHTKNITYEVILGDDCSNDLTTSISDRIKNIQVCRAEKNAGFLHNCNNSAKLAKGDFVVLLNNDTNVQPGWLDSLVEAMEAVPDIGMVGPKLLFSDGVLQEAGGIIWSDASGWNYGRGQPAGKSEYNYLRETDYISGACILLRRSLWEKLNGFDVCFCPAYYEDTDLAFRVREAGYKVIYQPASEVVHFEGISNGTDLNSGIKKNQVINQQVFLKRWKSLLEIDHFKNGEHIFQARDRSRHKKTVVIIDHYVPFYDKDAGSRSTFIYIKEMINAGINVKFVPANFFAHQPYTSVLQGLGVEVLLGEKYARTWKSWFDENAKYIDVIYLHRPHITEGFIDYLCLIEPRPKLIYFGHDLHFLRAEREAKVVGGHAEANQWKIRELNIFKKVDLVYYPSIVEVNEVKKISPNTNVSAIPLYFLNKPLITNYSHHLRNGILFVGGFGHPPNTDAVLWFNEHVMPLLISMDSSITFHVVGSAVPESIKACESPNVFVHGYLSDEKLNQLYTEVRLCVVPLRFGAGVKGKVLEALQAGLPIVTTPTGAEGIPMAEQVMKITESPQEMAQAIFDYHTNESACIKEISKYSEYIDKYFDKSLIKTIIEKDFIN